MYKFYTLLLGNLKDLSGLTKALALFLIKKALFTFKGPFLIYTVFSSSFTLY